MSSSRGARLRVVIDSTYAGANTTGVGVYSSRLSSELRRLSHQLGLEIECFGSACKAKGRANDLITTFQEWPTYTQGILPLQLLVARPQIVHATSHIGPLCGPGKLIVTVHDLIFMRYPHDYQRGWLAITRLLLPLVLRRAKAIIADSKATKDDVRSFFGVRSGKIVVIYPGFDLPQDSRKIRVANDSTPCLTVRTEGRPYLLALGPWVRRKNLKVVVQAFGLLAPEQPELQLIITGDKPRGMQGYTREELYELLPDGCRDRLHLVGYVSAEEKHALLAGAKVLCYPSRFEGFGLPPLEAMSAGVPVLAAHTPAVAEVTGGAAMLASPGDPHEWARSLRRLLGDDALVAQFREAGFLRSAAFTWERCARQTALLYRRVANPRSIRNRRDSSLRPE